MQDLIHCRMYILVTITGVQVCFTTRRRLVTTGHLMFIVVPLVTAWLYIVHA
ncbi:hypothetical protein IKE88_01355 [Candidatus Saccharibacteria bacterium]|nr:hypothetical protein [Candidatus Saccharibacteria bacterium]